MKMLRKLSKCGMAKSLAAENSLLMRQSRWKLALREEKVVSAAAAVTEVVSAVDAGTSGKP